MDTPVTDPSSTTVTSLMDPQRWLAGEGYPDLAETLATKYDVLTMNDLAVHIWQEETHPSNFPDLYLSSDLKARYKTAFASTPDYYAGHTFEELFGAFKLLAGGAEMLNSAALSKRMVVLGQGVSLREIIAVLESIDGSNNEGESGPHTPASVHGTKDAKISFVEYCRYMRFKLSGRKPPSIKQALKKFFNHYDRDRSGTLNATEVKKLLDSLNLKELEATTMISQADANHDGELSFEELYKQVKCASGHSNAAWTTLKIWLQMSSGWDVAPKDPDTAANFYQANPNAKLVTFIRHGQSEGNLASETCGSAKGWFNPHITPKGIKEAQDRGEELKSHKFELIVVSPMQRTLETYLHCCGTTGLNVETPVIGHPLAREQFSDSDDVGDKPSLIKAAWPKVNWELFPDTPEVWWYPGPDYTTPEQIEKLTVQDQRDRNMKEKWEEPWGEQMNRAAAFESWLVTRPEKEICVFSHGGFIECLVGPRMANAQRCVLRVGATPKNEPTESTGN